MKPDERASGPSKAPSASVRRQAPPAGHRLPSGLVALGSAAVVTIYSTGYFRTREAAARFAEDVTAGSGPGPRRVAAVSVPSSDAAKPATSAGTANPQGATSKALTPKSTSLKSATDVKSAPGSMPPANLNAAIANAATPSLASAAPTSAPESAAPSSAPSAPAAPTPKPGASPAADAAAADTAALRKWADGTYTGWGTSRHGDIEATVIIRNGAIASAQISQCLTRYSCSWVAALPGQVVARQTADVDYVSGATQSSNAFYYAVMDALSHAR